MIELTESGIFIHGGLLTPVVGFGVIVVFALARHLLRCPQKFSEFCPSRGSRLSGQGP